MKLEEKNDLNEIKLRLSTLSEDITIAGEDNGMVIRAALEYAKGKEDAALDMYTKQYVPTKVVAYDGEIKGECDMNEVLMEFSDGYEEFLESINKRAGTLIDRYSEAVGLLFTILSLPKPYSSILYLKYYKEETVKNIMLKLHLSRSSYFRLHNNAIVNLNCALRRQMEKKGDK